MIRLNLFIILCIPYVFIGCSTNCSSTGRYHSTFERFIINEKTVANNYSKSFKRSWDRQVNHESFLDDWNRNVGQEIKLWQDDPIERDSAVGRFITWEKSNAKDYTRDTIEKMQGMIVDKNLKPTFRKFWDEETGYKWYSNTEMPYRSEHKYTRLSTFSSMLKEEKQIATKISPMVQSYKAGFREDIDNFVPYSKKFISKLYCPLDI